MASYVGAGRRLGREGRSARHGGAISVRSAPRVFHAGFVCHDVMHAPRVNGCRARCYVQGLECSLPRQFLARGRSARTVGGEPDSSARATVVAGSVLPATATCARALVSLPGYLGCAVYNQRRTRVSRFAARLPELGATAPEKLPRAGHGGSQSWASRQILCSDTTGPAATPRRVGHAQQDAGRATRASRPGWSTSNRAQGRTTARAARSISATVSSPDSTSPNCFRCASAKNVAWITQRGRVLAVLRTVRPHGRTRRAAPRDATSSIHFERLAFAGHAGARERRRGRGSSPTTRSIRKGGGWSSPPVDGRRAQHRQGNDAPVAEGPCTARAASANEAKPPLLTLPPADRRVCGRGDELWRTPRDTSRAAASASCRPGGGARRCARRRTRRARRRGRAPAAWVDSNATHATQKMGESLRGDDDDTERAHGSFL